MVAGTIPGASDPNGTDFWSNFTDDALGIDEHQTFGMPNSTFMGSVFHGVVQVGKTPFRLARSAAQVVEGDFGDAWRTLTLRRSIWATTAAARCT